MARIGLNDFIEYHARNRAQGHTQAMLMLATQLKGKVTVVVHTRTFAKQLSQEHPEIQFVGLDDTSKLMGITGPILFDHHALEVMITEYQQKVLGRIAAWRSAVEAVEFAAKTALREIPHGDL